MPIALFVGYQRGWQSVEEPWKSVQPFSYWLHVLFFLQPAYATDRNYTHFSEVPGASADSLKQLPRGEGQTNRRGGVVYTQLAVSLEDERKLPKYERKLLNRLESDLRNGF